MLDFSYKKYQNNFPAPRERVLKYYDKDEDTLVTDIPAIHSSRRYTLVGAAPNPNYEEEQRLYNEEQLRLDVLFTDDLFEHYEIERNETSLTLLSLCQNYEKNLDNLIPMFMTFATLFLPPKDIDEEEKGGEEGEVNP